MSIGENSALGERERGEWIARGEGFAGRASQEIEVRAATLSSILDKHAVVEVDLLILDVEGAEVDVVKGLDFDRHAPRWIVAEDSYNDEVWSLLRNKGYVLFKTLLERKYTRDRLYERV